MSVWDHRGSKHGNKSGPWTERRPPVRRWGRNQWTEKEKTDRRKTRMSGIKPPILWSDNGPGYGRQGPAWDLRWADSNDWEWLKGQKAKIIWNLHSRIWCLDCDDSSWAELGQYVASPCVLGIVTAWWSQGSQFLKWGLRILRTGVTGEQGKKLHGLCLFFFNRLLEIQFTHHTIFPVQVYLSIVLIYYSFFSHHYSQLRNI